jgi:hypothetical protein
MVAPRAPFHQLQAVMALLRIRRRPRPGDGHYLVALGTIIRVCQLDKLAKQLVRSDPANVGMCQAAFAAE